MKRMLKAGAVLAATLLASKVAALEVGTPAVDFSAPSTHGEFVLSEVLAKGPVVLAFYFADFTPG